MTGILNALFASLAGGPTDFLADFLVVAGGGGGGDGLSNSGGVEVVGVIDLEHL